MSKTVLDEEREAKKTAGEVEEKLNALGHDSEDRGAAAALEEVKNIKSKEKKRLDDTANRLDSSKKDKYYINVYNEGCLRLKEWNPPAGFAWKFGISEKGLALYIRTPKGETYAQGMKILMSPLDDARGIDAIISMGLDHMDFIKNQTEYGHSKQK